MSGAGKRQPRPPESLIFLLTLREATRWGLASVASPVGGSLLHGRIVGDRFTNGMNRFV